MVAYWKCESSQTDVRLDYKFNAHAQAASAPLRNLMISIPIEGAVTSMQAKPDGEWYCDREPYLFSHNDSFLNNSFYVLFLQDAK